MLNKADLLVKAGVAFVQNREFVENCAIAIKNGVIVDIGSFNDLIKMWHADVILGGDNKLLMPGLVDAHTHVAQQLLRGAVEEQRPMVWARILVPYESCLTPEDVYISAKVACLEMIKSGITSFAEAGGPFPDAVCEAVAQMGLRAAVAPSTMDQGDFIPTSMKVTTEEALKNWEKLYSSWHGKDGRITIFLGLRQVMTSSPALIRATAKMAEEFDVGIHMHLAEHRQEVDYCLVNFGLRPAEWLDKCGVLSRRVLAAHAVLLTDREVKLLCEKGVNIVHCPRANLSHHGFPKITQFMSAGANVALGSDGAAAGPLDIWYAMRLIKIATLAHFGLPIHDYAPLRLLELVQMATIGGATALLLEEQIGSVEVGKKADLILVDLMKAELWPCANILACLTSYVRPTDVTDVVVNGKVLMKDREVLVCDEPDLIQKAERVRNEVFKRAGLA